MSNIDAQGFIAPVDMDGDSGADEPLPDYSSTDNGGMSGITLDETHIWAFDSTLARVFDLGLTMLMNDPVSYTLEGTERARNIFRRYAEKDLDALIDDWKAFQDTESEAYKELMWALDWVRDNFTALWT